MRHGVIVGIDEVGKQYLVNGDEGVPLRCTEIGALKSVVNKAAAEGLSVRLAGDGKSAKRIALAAGLLISNGGLIKKRKFPVGG